MTSGSDRAIAYGLDLAGYSRGKKSALARAEWRGDREPVRVSVLIDHPFAKRLNGIDTLNPEPEREAIKFMLGEGRLCVDVPIDLHGLLGLDQREVDARFVWGLTRRPVDFAFGGLAPLADRIGSPVMRLRNVLTTEYRDQLGSSLWETYPGATISLSDLFLQCKNEKDSLAYKHGEAQWGPEGWVAAGEGKVAATIVSRMASEMGITASDGTTINDDELDAVICALTGVAPRSALCRDGDLEKEILRRIEEKTPAKMRTQKSRTTAPRGYVLLLRRFWSEISLEKVDWHTEVDAA